MEKEILEKNIGGDETVQTSASLALSATTAPIVSTDRRPKKRRIDQRSHQKNTRKPGKREGRARAEFDHKIINIRRVTRVVTGGRRFSFSVVLVAGDKKGSVGVGIGKAGDTALAIEKAMRDAKKNMFKLSLNKNMSIVHEVEAKFSSSRVIILPAPGKGIIAGSSVRNVLELAGMKDVTAKLFSRSKNKLNNAQAAVKALRTLRVKKSEPIESVKK